MSVYPGSIDSDSTLYVARDNIQTKIVADMSAVSTVAIVSDSTGWVANMIATVDSEQMLVVSVAGSAITVTRAFAGTIAASHSAGKNFSNFVDAAYQVASKQAIIAIETALGANLANVLATGPYVNRAVFDFAAQTPGGSLVIGANTVTLTPVPAGVNGTDTQHYLYISLGTGTAEAALIIGGSAVSGNASGTVIIQCAHTHSGAWTIQSASAGIVEASSALHGSGTIVLNNAAVDIHGTMVLPTTINMIGQGTSAVPGSVGSIMIWRGGAGPCLVLASQYTDSLSGQYGVGIHRDYALYSASSIGDGVWIGGDPSNVITPSTWQGDYTNLEYVRVINFTNALVFQIANFVTFTNCNFSGISRAFLVPTTGQGLQYVNFISCVLTVPSGYAVQMDASSFGSGQVVYTGGQVSGTITGESLHWNSFGTHYEPNDGGAIVFTNNHSSVFEAYGGLMGTHNIAAGVGYHMFFNAGAGISWVRLSGIAVSDTASNVAKWVWFQSNGNLQIDSIVYFPQSLLTQLWALDGGGSQLGVMVSQPLMSVQTVTASATITWPTGNTNFPDSGVMQINGATVGGGINQVAGLITGQQGTIITANPQTFNVAGLIGNTLTTVAGVPYRFNFDGAHIWFH